jgi:FMN phosphatase YigB (HAD superfamily)
LGPETTLFVDDQEVNVVAATHAGMEAYVYTRPEPALARLGLVRG